MVTAGTAVASTANEDRVHATACHLYEADMRTSCRA